MLDHVRDRGSFTTADYDAMRAPWCATIGDCPRSRLFLHLLSTFQPAETLWPVADAALAPLGR